MDKEPYNKYICRVCGFVYDEEQGDPDSGLAPGTRFEDIPDDWTCPLCGVSRSDLVALEDYVPQQANAASVSRLYARVNQADEKNAIVIIGAGIAAWAVVAELRGQGVERPIIMIAAGAADYYPKPMLSMAFGQQRQPDELVEMRACDKALEHNVVLREHTRVIAINSRRQRVLTTRGSFAYGDLVLAVGAQQLSLQVAGDACDEIMRINDLQSYRALRDRLQASTTKRVTIIGAGLIGCELAEDLTSGDYQVTLVDRATLPLSQMLPPAMGESLVQKLTERGIRFLAGRLLERIDHHADAYRLSFNDSQIVDCDVVISALGLRPLTRLVRKAGIDFQQGILVDPANMRSSQPHVYALGDCAQVGNTCYAYIEPIHRQAKTLAAELSQQVAPLVRVKFPSLALTICPPPADERHRDWQVIASSAGALHMEYRVDGTMLGFALSGEFTQRAAELYGIIKRQARQLATEQPGVPQSVVG